jgi:protein gp37
MRPAVVSFELFKTAGRLTPSAKRLQSKLVQTFPKLVFVNSMSDLVSGGSAG